MNPTGEEVFRVLTTEDVAWFRVDDPSVPGAARRAAVDLALRAGFTESRAGEVAISVVEAASNQLRHASGGSLLVRRLRSGDEGGVEFVALDSGPGMRSVPTSAVDGTSTAGTLGIGLGAIRRLASHCDLHSVVGRGTVLTARFWRTPADLPSGSTGISRPMTGEDVCGDRWMVRRTAGWELLLLCDGLGHGPLAALAAEEAARAFLAHDPDSPAEILRAMHREMRHTRGAAAAVALLDPRAGRLVFAGVGNITAVVSTPGRSTHLISYPGIVGHQLGRFREQTVPLPDHWTLVLHSDGLRDRWTLDDYPGLRERSPLVIAATLLRDAGVRRDDAGVLVARP